MSLKDLTGAEYQADRKNADSPAIKTRERPQIGRIFSYLFEHYSVTSVLLAQLILTFLGAGNSQIVSLLGVLLCAVGLLQNSARADFWVLIPLTLYCAMGMGSSWMAFGNITDGYGSMHLIFPTIYLLMSCLREGERSALRKLCARWTGIVAMLGIGEFIWQAMVQSSAGRLSGILGNPNAMGGFLVIGWFLLIGCRDRKADLARMEPLILIALALTLSLGSFVGMAAGIVILLAGKWRSEGRREALRHICRLLARVSLALGTGVLLYLAAARTGMPWFCLIVAGYGAALVVFWPELGRFLERFRVAATVMAACGIAVAVVIVAVRPSSVATFTERLEMMGSGASYLTDNPLFGIGPLQWRQLDLQDGGKYFNTWHIHNVPLHVAVEMGWPAAVFLLLTAVRLLRKKGPAERAGFGAFCVHNLIDTSFFYLGITSLALVGVDRPGDKYLRLEGMRCKLWFAAFAALFAVHFIYSF